MTLILYINNSAINYVNKDIVQIGSTKSIDIYDNVNIINPTFVLNYDASFLKCNYCYVPDLSRYYYVDVTLESAKRLILNCTVDALMSFRDDILESDCTVIRSESIGNPTYVVDDKLPIMQGSCTIGGQLLPLQPLNTDILTNTVLITLGG